jgi:ATP adenylyltransferase
LLNKEKEGKTAEGSPEPKRAKVEKKEPFKPPYVPELYVGSLAGIEGEGNLSVLVSCFACIDKTK